MQYLKIQNSGLLPEELLYLMGGTTKAEDDYKIGKFGTGLKYTLAFMVRNNIDFRIFIGEREINIGSKTINVRDTTFHQITINGRDTSITDTMGLDWKLWMVIREIYCNALDEGDVVREVTSSLEGSPGTTTFYIQAIPPVLEIVNAWGNYFLHDLEPLFECEKFALYPKSNRFQIFKQGVLIHDDPDEKAVFRYDLKTADINELREYRGIKDFDVGRCVSKLPNNLVGHFIQNVRGTYEETFDYGFWDLSFSEGWEDAIGNAKVIDYGTLEKVKARRETADLGHIVGVPKGLFKALTSKFEGISALRVADKMGAFFEVAAPKVDRQVKKGLAILESCDYFIEEELSWSVGVFGVASVLARVDMDDKHIMISEKVGSLSLFEVCSILVEENEHYRTGFDDETREFQTHFISMFLKELLKKNKVEL